jgi:hypothetical protein
LGLELERKELQLPWIVGQHIMVNF